MNSIVLSFLYIWPWLAINSFWLYSFQIAHLRMFTCVDLLFRFDCITLMMVLRVGPKRQLKFKNHFIILIDYCGFFSSYISTRIIVFGNLINCSDIFILDLLASGWTCTWNCTWNFWYRYRRLAMGWSLRFKSLPSMPSSYVLVCKEHWNTSLKVFLE